MLRFPCHNVMRIVTPFLRFFPVSLQVLPPGSKAAAAGLHEGILAAILVVEKEYLACLLPIPRIRARLAPGTAGRTAGYGAAERDAAAEQASADVFGDGAADAVAGVFSSGQLPKV